MSTTNSLGQATLLPEMSEDVLPNEQNAPEDDHKPYTIIQVAVNHLIFTPYDYKLPGEYAQDLTGCRVLIKFGKKKNFEVGVILQAISASDFADTELKKELKIAKLLDKHPLIQPDLMKTLLFGADYYHYPIGPVLLKALPTMLRTGASATYKELPGLQNLVKPEKLEEVLAGLKSAKQRELLLDLQSGAKRIRELREQGYTSAQESVLIRKKYVKKIDLANGDQLPTPYPKTEEDLYLSPPLPLNEEQQHALEAITKYDGYGVFLINGVTGSGKTEVYLQVIAHTLLQGKKALILVPEISLTPQTFRRFYQRFKVPIATLHSNLSNRERLDGYLDMYNQKALILIGTRSALFTPIPDLGLIVIDEEHDSSFKQTDTFRYHARTLAIYRAQLVNCKVVLGSATPSIETLYHVKQGHYAMLELKQRALNSVLPKITIVDLRKEPKTVGLKAGISETFEEKLGVNAARHFQSILFINRRGYARQLYCMDCSQPIHCPHCDVPMTVHRSLNTLMCHICNTQMSIPKSCPNCGSFSIVETGVGTEQIEGYLQARFPDVCIERIDRDAIKSTADLNQTLSRIRDHSTEIMVGTQMLAKGHDFPDVTLVGILNVDGGICTDDFRATEQTLQLITQVAGRAGRANKKGEVMIQTMFPQHQMLATITSDEFDYTKAAMDMLAMREESCQPPYYQEAVLMCSALDRDTPYQYLTKLSDTLKSYWSVIPNVAIGPIMPDRIEKKMNRYHFHFSLRCQDPNELRYTLYAVVNITKNMPHPRELRFAIDVDPFYSP